MIAKELIHELRLGKPKKNAFQMRYYLMTYLRQDLCFRSRTYYGIRLEKETNQGTEEFLFPCVSQKKEEVVAVLNAIYDNQSALMDSAPATGSIPDLY